MLPELREGEVHSKGAGVTFGHELGCSGNTKTIACHQQMGRVCLGWGDSGMIAPGCSVGGGLWKAVGQKW